MKIEESERLAALLTRRERICLQFLADKLHVPARLCGVTISRHVKGRGGNYSAIGMNVLCALRRKGYATLLTDISEWRITSKGREFIELEKGEVQEPKG